ncbi:MAG: hypothetical protein FD189_707 [Elusimicrobia bacterium]|nr:MAG: hypothetical protein FD154_1330 [Elusimicrobiota bacterium]KAF0157138.1 MAG: hypothetical protein FD189_707 [Elusimicrobiota bacterium]
MRAELKGRTLYLALAAAAGLAFHLWGGFSFIRASAPTYDEPVHLASGYSYLKTGRYAMNIMDHPPFSEMFSALPLLFRSPESFLTHPYFDRRMPYHYSDYFLYNNTVPPDELLNTARAFGFLAWTAGFSAVIFLFCLKLHSPAAGLAALAVYYFLPVFISNNALVATDSAAALFYAASLLGGFLFALKAYGSSPVFPRREMLLAAACAGLAMASKFSMFIVPPLVAGLWVLHMLFFSPRREGGRVFLHALLYCGLSLAVLAVVYRGDLGLYFEGLNATIRRLGEGRSSFAMGNYSSEGVWWYFPAAFLLKNPAAFLMFLAAGLTAVFRNRGPALLWLALPFIFYFGSALTSRVQIGVRHLLPAMPLAAAMAGLGLVGLLSRRRGALLALPAAALSVFFVVAAHPSYLAYFSEAAGGKKNGWKYLTDSNLDWGQDLLALGTKLRAEGSPPVVLSYFGVARPEYYGIKHLPLGFITNVPEIARVSHAGDLCASDRRLLAVSATNLQATYYPDRDRFAWLWGRAPYFSAGGSIFLYDLAGDAAALEKAADLLHRSGYPREAACWRLPG